MHPEKLRDYLARLDRKGLEDLCDQTFGDRKSSAKNKESLIEFLMSDVGRVAKALGSSPRWWERSSTHVYGVLTAIGTLFALFAFFYPRTITTPPQIDPLRTQIVLDQVERVRASQPEILREPSMGRVQVEAVSDPTTSGFELIEHSVVCDLRSFKPVPSVDRDQMLSPVVQHIRQRIKKLSKSTTYRLSTHTSGIDVFSRSPTHKLVVQASNERRAIAEHYRVKPRLLEFDVSAEPTGREFTIEVSKTFWNAFNYPDQSWVGIIVGLPTRSISYLVVFPDDKPYISFKQFVDDEHHNRIDLPAEHYVLEDSAKRWIWWNIVNPKPGHSYNIDWEW